MEKHRVRLGVERLEDRSLPSGGFGWPGEWRSIDGTGNNRAHPEWGGAGGPLLRIVPAAYADGMGEMAGQDLPNPRAVSNTVVAQDELTPNDRHLTSFIWLWGQFIDHDLSLTDPMVPAEPAPIPVPAGDPFFDPLGTGTQTIPFDRSRYDPTTGDSPGDPRRHINELTAWLDGSMVYGSDPVRAAALRAFEGGRLKTSEGDLLPFNTAGLPNLGGNGPELFLAGDVRANENAALTSMHTLWVREHNRVAGEIAAAHPGWGDERVFQAARAWVIAEIQAITFNEFLPALLGPGALPAYRGYDPSANPGIATVFSTAAYRVGHTLLPPELLRLGPGGDSLAGGPLPLRDAFFAVDRVIADGIDPFLRGVAAQVAQEIDAYVIDDVRNFLFGPPGAGGLDLPALNIQRGRDHGLPDYTSIRRHLGLRPAADFADITSDPEVQERLRAAYGSVDRIDPWVGAIAEDHVPGGSVGELIRAVLADQFGRLRDGDRFWYQRVFHGPALAELERTTLADVVRRNTGVDDIQANAFFDRSVMYHRSHGRSAGARVEIDGGMVRLVDGRSGKVLESRPVGEVSRVMLVGSEATPDRFTIDLRRAGSVLPGAIEVHAGAGWGDMLTVLATPGSDVIGVSGPDVTVNGLTIGYSGAETLMLWTHRSDRVEFGDRPDAWLIWLPYLR